MTSLKDKIQDALDESRMLVLGAEILVGFEFSAHFQDGYDKLRALPKSANTAALTLMLVVLALLLAPCAFHQVTAHGEDRTSVHRFTTRIMDIALFPFAIGLGLTVFIPAEQITGPGSAAALAGGTVLAAGILWYGPALLQNKHPENRNMNAKSEGGTSVHDKIRQALTEARVVIPGNQALLGFQFAVILQRGFADLAPWLKWIHLASLILIALSTILLMTPAAFHRLAERGEETPRFYWVVHWMILCSLPPLALGICGDFFLVWFKIGNNAGHALIAGACMLALFIAMWIGYPLWRRRVDAEFRIAKEEI
ncbi:MAG: DUF6328 family protein [Acidobacteriota bacterium]|nr:DUF6328 family protein [Acidobacteriota bacterium]